MYGAGESNLVPVHVKAGASPLIKVKKKKCYFHLTKLNKKQTGKRQVGYTEEIKF